MSVTPHESWAKCLTKLEAKLYPQSFETWLQPLQCERFDSDTVLLRAPHAFAVDWIKEHYLDDIRTAIRRIFKSSPEIEFEATSDDISDAGHDGTASEQPEGVILTADTTQRNVGSCSASNTTAVNSRYVFESLVVGNGNEVAYTAAHTVAHNPGRTPFNPLFIYGGVGLGKTHIMHAVANESMRVGARPVYVTSEQFSREFVASLKDRKTHSFADRFRAADVLLIDDVQFFEGKERMQEELFHTFNVLHAQGKQIILSSDRSPEDLQGLQDRIISRIQWGLVADIQPPDLETRMAICQQKAEQSGLHLDDALTEFIAKQVRANVRELEGIVNRILFLVEKLDASLSRDVVEQAVEAMRGKVKSTQSGSGRAKKPVRVDVPAIIDAVAEQSRTDRATIMGKSRKADVVLNRQMAMFLCRALTPLSVRAIADAFGGRDHATVVRSCRKFEQRAADDPSLLWEARTVAGNLGCELSLGSSS